MVCVGVLGRGYWTPDEPREADIAWRMSWQPEKAVPVLAGEAFCEKPPLTYWLAALAIKSIGSDAWAARLPNLLYALISAVAVGLLGARSAGALAGLAAAAAVSTFLLAYQTAIWLATDAPLLAAVCVALYGAYRGFYAVSSAERLRGYVLMHIALGVGFLCKSAAAWVIPATVIVALSIWEKRWRELLRWELYAGLVLQAAIILTWVWFVYMGSDGLAHLKVFFWNNVVGRFTQVEAPAELQYAAAHRNTPGKYLIEMPVYLFPWTLLVLAAARRAWLARDVRSEDYRAVRFGVCASVPALLILSLAATARNIYVAPALPGIALLLGWWATQTAAAADRWDLRALRATVALLLLSATAFGAALILVAIDAGIRLTERPGYVLLSVLGLGISSAFALHAWRESRGRVTPALWSLLIAYAALLIGPASQIYAEANRWQDLAQVARAVERDAAGRPLLLLAPDETTRAVIDMYARTSVQTIVPPLNGPALQRMRSQVEAAPETRVLVLVPGRSRPPAGLSRRPAPAISASLPWISGMGMQIANAYSLPNGRRYALLRRSTDEASDGEHVPIQ